MVRPTLNHTQTTIPSGSLFRTAAEFVVRGRLVLPAQADREMPAVDLDAAGIVMVSTVGTVVRAVVVPVMSVISVVSVIPVVPVMSVCMVAMMRVMMPMSGQRRGGRTRQSTEDDKGYRESLHGCLLCLLVQSGHAEATVSRGSVT